MNKKARSKKGDQKTRAKPVESSIRRAAERAGTKTPTHYIAPWPGDPNPGKTLLDSLKASEWPGDHAAILRGFARNFEAEAERLSPTNHSLAMALAACANLARAGIATFDEAWRAMWYVRLDEPSVHNFYMAARRRLTSAANGGAHQEGAS